MKILVIGKFYEDAFALHIAETLDAMGHAVSRFHPGQRAGGNLGKLRHRFNQAFNLAHAATDNFQLVRQWRMRALWDTIQRSPPEVVVVCHDYLWPAEVAELKRRSGAVVALWFPDSMVNFGRGMFMTAPYDALFVKDPYILQALGGFLPSPIHYLPECFNPHAHLAPTPATPRIGYQCEVTTVGNLHSYRATVFAHLQQFDVKLWGPPVTTWMRPHPVSRMHQGRAVLNHEKALALLGAKIVVNNLLYGEIWGLNARAFEVAGIGAFQLIDWRPGLAQLFVDGVELISFRGPQDLLNKIRFWLPQRDERLAIAEAGKRRAWAEHTYQLRLQLLLDTLAGKARGFPLPRLNDGP